MEIRVTLVTALRRRKFTFATKPSPRTERGRLCDGGCKVLRFQADRQWGSPAKRVPWAD